MSTRLQATVLLGLLSTAGTCDRVYIVNREAPLPNWPDPTCVDSALRASPSLGEVTHVGPRPSMDDSRLTVHHFAVSAPSARVSLWLETDSGHQRMRVRLHWSRMHRQPSEPERAALAGLMDAIEERVAPCSGMPAPSKYAEHRNW
jgi:hypothetical protein